MRAAEDKIVASRLDKEYAAITGVGNFTAKAAELAYGADSAPLKEGRIAITQSVSGTGALRIGGAFLERFYPGAKKIFLPTPTWANHNAVFSDSGLEVGKYRYYNKDTIGLDFEGLVEDLKAAPKGSIILLHACAHNPTGVDPTADQWRQISDVVKEKEHFAFFDMAYQGFASGNADKDAFAPRYFVEQGHNIALCQSFAKNMVRLPFFPFWKSRCIQLTVIRVSTVNVQVHSHWSALPPRKRSASTLRSRFSFAPFTPTLLSTAPASRPPS